MQTYTVKHPALGIELDLTGSSSPQESDIWEAIKMTQPPEVITNAYFQGGQAGKEVARDAYRNGFFEGAGIGEALSHIGGLAVEGGEEFTGRFIPGRAGTEGAALRRKYDAVRLDPKDMRPGGITHKNERGDVRDLYDHAEGLKAAGMQLHGLMAADVDGDVAMDQVIKTYGLGWWPDQKEIKKWISLYQGMYADDSLKVTGYRQYHRRVPDDGRTRKRLGVSGDFG